MLRGPHADGARLDKIQFVIVGIGINVNQKFPGTKIKPLLSIPESERKSLV
jgi:biotin-(acetyl-CoA carboxylase) ligase